MSAEAAPISGAVNLRDSYLGAPSRTIQAVMVLVAALSAGYSAVFLVYDREALAGLIAVDLLCMVALLAGVVLVRRGLQLQGALLVLTLMILQIVVSTRYLGWQSGVHLYLISGGALAILVFTDAQRVLRWLFGAGAAIVFVVCQFLLPSSSAIVQVSEQSLSVMFTLNAVLTALVTTAFAMTAHARATQAWKQAVEATARAEYLANTDTLTGLPNRRPVLDVLEDLSRQGSGAFCLAIADLDHFKKLNDTYGHQCGDRVLATVGRRLRQELRVTDTIGRWGGEEFLFVMPGVAVDDAQVMMERIRRIVADHVVPCTGHSHEVQISIGLADGLEDEMSHRVIKRADDALYEAKAGGRNQVCVRSIHDLAPGSDADRALQAHLRATRAAARPSGTDA
ncbi:GGDEF domain-containing protein [Demequina zhanjiangensis]|uniref:GGDEF domain-containing protein n=1 Tax=Demequina zhanjiangensis TaxID=3051659 RepID=A0ABT8FXF2_9MICO|nr:GGDEF domain-containing protein [Demequina sp. SYSU T00b26]MDN4471581.1 GGDEF domain-containing protein [Demequina sp. SYSU T00b26]